MQPGPRVVVFRLTGDMDFSVRDKVRRTLESLTDADIAVIDMTEVSYADSSFLNALVALHHQYEERRTPFAIRLVGLGKPLRRLFEITQLDGLFEFWDSVDDASSSGIVTNP